MIKIHKAPTAGIKPSNTKLMTHGQKIVFMLKLYLYMSGNPKPPIESPNVSNRLLGAGAALVLAVGGAATYAITEHLDGAPGVEHISLITPNADGSPPETPPAVTLTPSEEQKPTAKVRVTSSNPDTSHEVVSPITQSSRPQVRRHRAEHRRQTDHMPRPVRTTHYPRPAELLNLHPENLVIPPAAAQIMAENTVFTGNCSGYLIRNSANQPIGIATARHCVDHDLVTDADGQPDLVFDNPLSVETGDILNNMTGIGDMTEFAINPPSDSTKDQALAAINGNSIQDVLANYDPMSPEQIASLQTGDVVYSSGWPATELNNSGPSRRESFAMSVLGTDTWYVEGGLELKVLVVAVPQNADGAVCSPGVSGSGVIALGPNNQPGFIGTISAATDFNLMTLDGEGAQAEIDRTAYENQFGVDLSGYAAVCGIAYESPTPANGAIFARATAPEDPYFSPLAILERQYTADFFNPDFTRQVINGVVVISGLKGPQYIDRPAVYYDPTGDGTTLLAWYDPSPDDLTIQAFLGSDSLQSINIYSDNDGQSNPGLITSTGEVTPNDDTWPGSPGFTDANGLHFGEQPFIDPLTNDQATDLSQSALSIVNGQLSINLVPNAYRNQEADEAAAIAAFDDPKAPKDIVNGTIVLPIGSETSGTVVNRPYVYYNSADGSVVIGYSTTKDGGQLDTYYYPSPNYVQFYQDSEADPVTINTITSPVSFQGDSSGQTDGGYVTTDGFVFGQQVVNPPASQLSGQSYVLVAQSDGSLSVQPTQAAG